MTVDAAISRRTSSGAFGPKIAVTVCWNVRVSPG
jgi:hypothetical protein